MREYIIKFETDTPLSEITAGSTVRAMIKTVGDCDEVIRCKDCKWADWYTVGDGRTYCYCSETGKGGNEEDDFCSYGERKQETK